MASSLNGTSGENLNDVLDAVEEVLRLSEQHDLSEEVIATTLIYLKENPKVSIAYALGVGLRDWDI